jgi:hypothetical protein
MALLDRAGAITARTGENARGMDEIGGLLREIRASGALEALLAARPGGKRAAVDVIAEHTDGSILSLYAMENWESPPSTDVHWHNYWQVLLVVEGAWPDTVWSPVAAIADGVASGIAIDRREVIREGELQVLGPDEPHGWLADDIRRTPKATLLMWSANARGKPRVVLDPETGRLSDEFDFLNPTPEAALERAGGSSASWSRY